MNFQTSITGLSKHLVGEYFTLELTPDNCQEISQLELYTNLNRAKLSYLFTKKETGSYSISIKLNLSGFFWWQARYKTSSDSGWRWVESEGKKLKAEVQVDPAWLSDAIVYNVFVRFFKGKIKHPNEKIHPGEGGTFDDVKYHLDDLKSMGVNTLYFNPIHLIGELYRKYNHLDQLPPYLQPGSPYSIKDYKSIDPELTYDRDSGLHLLSDPQQEFRDLVKAAHRRGMYVIMDLVFNHTAHDFIFQRIRPEWYLYKENHTSLEEPYLYPEDVKQGKPWGDPKHTMAPFDHGLWWDDAAQLNWEYMIPPGPNKPPKNSSLDEMWEYFKSIPKYWIRHFGVDGFRCDIAYRVPTGFWKACIAEARKEAITDRNNLSGDVVFIGETFTVQLKELQEAGFAAIYGDYSNKLNRPLDLKGYLDYMYNMSGTHFPQGSKWFIFPECHDFNRTPQKVLGDQAGQDRQADLRANQSRWLLTATLPGIPLIFNGFEKIEWQPIDLFSYGAVDWESDLDLRKFITKVNYIRHHHEALKKGCYEFVPSNQGLNHLTQLFSFVRRTMTEILLIVVNMDVYLPAGPAILYLPQDFNGQYTLVDLLTGKKYKREGQELIVHLEPGESHIFKIVND